MVRYEIRGASPDDEEQLLRLAEHLDSVNLPHDRDHVRRLLDHTDRSYSGKLKSLPHRKYVFVLWDLEKDVAVGTSMLVAQLGRRDAPYIYFDVIEEEKYSSLLDKHFHHTALKIGFSYKGPTEIGGLVVAPEYRAAREKLGLQISYVRFLYVATHRELFQNELLAELLPPLESDGTSHLWEALGRQFTDMSYAEADLLSSENKEFIRDLFPAGLIYASLLSKDAQDVIGKVGAQTKGVERMLRRIGFRYAERVDPFDGGPHFTAPLEEITLVQESRRSRVVGFVEGDTKTKKSGLIGRDLAERPYFRAVYSALDIVRDGEVRIGREAGEHLGLAEGDEVLCLPI
ncbi:MAG: arginine N-succinyltransferase [Myxococcales bacterium]|nr:arginine N-succinyltransferase [Myxococcales bacterium]MCB9575854.1 arginine N-succinyltransferase [Polyangiaceae bacterium]